MGTIHLKFFLESYSNFTKIEMEYFGITTEDLDYLVKNNLVIVNGDTYYRTVKGFKWAEEKTKK